MTATAETDLKVNVELIEMDVIKPSKTNPRKDFEREGISKLAASIAQHGVLNPIVVRVHPEDADCFEIIAGERRYRAAKKAKRKLVLCRIIECDDATAIELQATENLDREQLNPIEEAVTWQQLLDTTGLTQVKLAAKYRRNQSVISNSLRLLKLPKEWQKKLIKKEIPFTFARELASWVKYPQVFEQLPESIDRYRCQYDEDYVFSPSDYLTCLKDAIHQVSRDVSELLESLEELGKLEESMTQALKIVKMPEHLAMPGAEKRTFNIDYFHELWEFSDKAEQEQREREPAPPKRQTEMELAKENAGELAQADQAAKERIEERELHIDSERPAADVQADIEHAQQQADRKKAAQIDPQIYERYKLEWLETQVTQAISKSNWTELAQALGIRIDVHWRLDEAFLKLHTKNQLLDLAREWGFDVEALKEYQSNLQGIVEAMLIMDRQSKIQFDQGDEKQQPARAPLALIRCEVKK